MFSSFVLPCELERLSEKSRRGVFNSLVAVRESCASALEEFELGIVVRTLNEVNYPSQPALFYNRFIGFGASSLARHPGVGCRLLHALLDEHSENLEESVKVFRG